jgi:vanillate/3-O-methylgallate O-demethylase
MKKYREWLPASSYEATGSIGGSFVSKNIEDYYVTPYEMGYGSFIKFDHDFIGKEALQKMAGKPHRRKVTFAWNPDDVVKIWRSMLEPGDPYKFLDIPLSNYTSASYDRIMLNGKQVGLNMFSGYSYNERSFLSLGIVNADVPLGTEVKLVWGEEDGGTKKTTVERHRQIEIRAKVSAAPYSKQAQTTYHEGWRSKATA